MILIGNLWWRMCMTLRGVHEVKLAAYPGQVFRWWKCFRRTGIWCHLSASFIIYSFWDAILSTDSCRLFLQVRNGVSLPSFLKDFLVPIIRAGQQLQVLIKLFEFCKYIAPGINTYDDFLPCWKGFSDPSRTSPLSFSKWNIEELILARNNYYNKMQEKLEEVSAKLEFRYHQVIQLFLQFWCMQWENTFLFNVKRSKWAFWLAFVIIE